MKLLLDPQLAELVLRNNQAKEKLSASEEVQMSVWIRMNFRGAENAFYQHRMGTFDDQEFDGYRNFYSRFFLGKNSREWWLVNKEDFSMTFRNSVESIYNEAGF